MAKYIFVTGGVVSGLGKGITAASLGLLLKRRGLNVFVQKFDPYINVDPGNMSPLQHGEVFVTADGCEADLDLGHYERFVDTELSKNSSTTTGKVYLSILTKERQGGYEGKTVQVIPHVTNEIKERIYRAGKESGADIVINEIGGTVGDIESLPYIETIRQVRSELGKENTLFIHATLVPMIEVSNELKTKPTQHSVKDLRSFGIQPDIIVCRTGKYHLEDNEKDKLSLFCDVKKGSVIEAYDCETLYDIPLMLKEQHMDDIVCEQFGLTTKESDISALIDLSNRVKTLENEVTIALVGEYIKLPDAYLSVIEALKHAGYKISAKIRFKWIDSSEVNSTNASELLKDVDGIIVPGGDGETKVNGMIDVIKYARENNIPFLGLSLGMQLGVIEFARNVLHLEDANSEEYSKKCLNPVIHLIKDKEYVKAYGNYRVGNYECDLVKDSLVAKAYNETKVLERHRNRYEFNNDYLNAFNNNGLKIVGINKERNLVSMLELNNHPFFVLTLPHLEFKSRPLRPHPLFLEFIKASFDNQLKLL
ncbi:MAG: CTP synthase [Bacilli bacterium]|nr:CTP synthase [Bacilli bacterium]